MNFKDAIIIIISHSGGTFAPLACSNLMQSFSPHIFAVSSEWDTQVGKQLRGMYGDKNDLVSR
jgi:D-arabinose 5-phosphate isomerase GutQ